MSSDMDYIILPHRICRKDENGRVLAEISFPEHRPGEYCIEDVYVDADLSDFAGIGMELVKLALNVIDEHGGSVKASDPFGIHALEELGRKS